MDSTHIEIKLGERLRHLMKHRKVKAIELATMTGMTRSMVSLWISNHSVPSLDSVIKIKRSLNLSEQEFMFLVFGNDQ